MPKQKVDLREWASPVEKQWQLGSCTAQAVVGAYELLLKMHYPNQFADLSRLFLYYNARKIEGDINSDSGAYVSSAIRAVEQYGLCRETLWPYDIDKYKTEPTWQCYLDARNKTISKSYKLSTSADIIEMLNEGRPVVVGANVYYEFDNITKSNPILSMPRISENIIGSHAMCVVGFDNLRKLFIVRNSFGDEWGDNGHLFVPYEYADNHFLDNWAFDILVKSNTNNLQ